jgi:hypothetical protein
MGKDLKKKKKKKGKGKIWKKHFHDASCRKCVLFRLRPTSSGVYS